MSASTSTATASPADPTTRAPVARRLRRYMSGVALILFPALLVVEAPIDPAGDGTGEEMYAAATGHSGALAIAAALLFISGVLMIPAVAAILHQSRDRGSALANIGAVLGVLGGFGHAAIAMFYLFALAIPGGDQAEMESYVERINASAAVGAVVFPLILCFALGVLVLGWTAWRAGLVGWWGPVAITVAVIVAEVLPFGPAFQVGANVLATAVFGYLGVRVIRMTDSDWVGVRPAA